jgi:hypothetical protein
MKSAEDKAKHEVRNIAVEAHYDSLTCYDNIPCPKVRLKGRWLQAAGFNPGTQIQVTVCSPGVLELRVIGSERDRAARLGSEFLDTAQRLDLVLAKGKGEA